MDILLQYSDLITRLANIIIIAYGLYKFLGKPHTALEERVKVLEVKVKEHDDSLMEGRDNFREQKKVNSLIINSIVALIEFEVDYCIHHGDEKISPRLENIKNKLYEFLSEK